MYKPKVVGLVDLSDVVRCSLSGVTERLSDAVRCDGLCSLQGVTEDDVSSGEVFFPSDSAVGLGDLTIGVLGLSNRTLLGPVSIERQKRTIR